MISDHIANLVQALDSGSFMPHGYCLVWSEPLLVTYVVSDSLIGFSYYSIPFALTYFVYKRRDLAFNWMFIMFSVFIFACGTTHFMGVWTIWNPNYWADAGIRYFTGVVSFITAVMLWLLLPKALKLPSPAQLERLNAELQAQITERQAAEQQLHQLNLALRQRTTELEAANRELEAFSYSVSHDLRSPLGGINGFSQALLEDYGESLDETAKNYLGRITGNAQRMGVLIDDLLKLGRISRSEVKHEVVSLSGIARDVAESLRLQYPHHQPDFSCIEELFVKGDAGLLRIVMENLLDNAWKFTSRQAEARVVVGVSRKGSEAVYFVRDNGAGFDMQHAQQLFQPFQRLHAGTDFSGTGIGLVTVRRIIERHGGLIWVESREGEGTTFFFTLGALNSEEQES